MITSQQPSRDPADVAREEAEERRLERSISRDRQARSNSRVRMGRGGAGNYVSPTREDPEKLAADQAYEQKIIEAQIAKDDAHFHSTGRGGAGNVSACYVEINVVLTRDAFSVDDQISSRIRTSQRSSAPE